MTGNDGRNALPDRQQALSVAGRNHATRARKVVLIDDKKLVLQTVKRLLADTAFSVQLCEDSFSGLLELARHVPQSVFIDAGMNGLNGQQLCALIKDCPRLQSVRVIIMLEQSDPLLQAKALAAGADNILYKPFGKNELLSLIQPGHARAA